MRRIGAGTVCGFVALSLVLALVQVGTAWAAEKYPSRPIQMCVGFPGGAGGADMDMRIKAKHLEKIFNVPVMPVNKPGAGGVIGATYVLGQPPDGYTIGCCSDNIGNAIILGQATYKMEDVRIICSGARLCNVIAVHPDAQWKTFKELMEYSKKNPGVKYAHPGVGSGVHIRVENINALAKMGWIGVPVKGDADVATAVLGKHVPVAALSGTTAKPLVEAGRIRLLLSFEPPAEVGLDPSTPDFNAVFGKDTPDLDIRTYVYVHARTPESIIQAIRSAMQKMSKDPEYVREHRNLMLQAGYIDGEEIMKGFPARMERIRALYKQVGMLK